MADYLPLRALKAFDATARLGSFKKAADELHVTTGAVSQQVKTLEDILGVKLFHRLHHSLELIDAAKAGFGKIESGFDLLNDAMQSIRDCDTQAALKVWVAPSFASKFLLPKLKHFSNLYPNTDLSVFASDIMIGSGEAAGMIPAKSFHKKDIDIGIFYGRSEFKDYRADKLFGVDIVPLCSPTLICDSGHPLQNVEDMMFHSLIHDDTANEGRPDWNGWLRLAGVHHINADHGIRFNQVSLALDAAVDGQGIVLGIKQLAEQELKNGQLVIPFGPEVTLDYAYYIVSLKDTQNEPSIRAFREWLLELTAG
ncbi:LysR substrate-binding domain-containing protein [Marinomonas mediterranea]|uniref:LysR substrate-binding domain-containing protein n=1 Tax=Marinomonas mediterranea TaxID=119864 RepID=UPI002348FDC1|nr:LysR substrate-binding domain-containing protein [Marinomonas mediterranea]WCN10231.1 LysR family transcriptional regulator [Marinomonas mediterranea]